MPRRIQKSTTPGRVLPSSTVDVSAAPWANPYTPETYRFAVGDWRTGETRPSTPADQVLAYRRDLTCTDQHCFIDMGDGMINDEHPWMRELDLAELTGKDLACSCPTGQPCHADVLLELANPGLCLQCHGVQPMTSEGTPYEGFDCTSCDGTGIQPEAAR